MPYTVTAQFYDAEGALQKAFLPDAYAVFDLQHDARQHLLALIADEIGEATETRCLWISADTLELVQPHRPAPYHRRVYRLVPTKEQDA